MSATHSSWMLALALIQLSVSAALSLMKVLLRSCAALRPAAWLSSQVLPICLDSAAPELLSMTFFRSAGRLSY